MNLDLILLDLDETLLPTESLREVRHSRTPIELHNVSGFDAIRLHEGIAASLDTLAGLTSIGLVTSSPRWYVEQILAIHLPDCEFVLRVTYEDVENIKPHPEPLMLALRMVGVDPQRALYVGDADLDFDASTAAGVDFIGAGWADRPTFPASAPWVRTPQDLVELIGSRA